MSQTMNFEPGGYRFVPGVFQYSGAVAAMPGYRIERISFGQPLPLLECFQQVERLIAGVGRPITSLCSFELRSPAPLSESGFHSFNDEYVRQLSTWGLMNGSANPVSRSNVCPEVDPPASPSVHAFAYTTKADAPPSFVVSGSGEAPEGRGNYRDHIVHLDDCSPDGLKQKARFVVSELSRRMLTLGFGWSDVTATQIYTVHDFHFLLPSELLSKGVGRSGLTWHFCRPPVIGLDYEMDCRSLQIEHNR